MGQKVGEVFGYVGPPVVARAAGLPRSERCAGRWLSVGDAPTPKLNGAENPPGRPRCTAVWADL